MGKSTLRSFEFLGADAHLPIINKSPSPTASLNGRRAGQIPFSSSLGFSESNGSIYTGGYIGFYLYIGNIPGSTGGVAVIWRDKISVDNLLTLTMNNSYQLRLNYRNGISSNAIVSADISSALSINTWHKIEIKYDVNASTYVIDAALRVNNVVICNVTGLAGYNTGDAYGDAGEILCPLTGGAFYVSDYFNVEDQFSSKWWYDWDVLLVHPTSDVQIGTWTGGAGGTTNLWDAVNNNPPIGTATETNLTQIESADGAGNTTVAEYRAGFGSLIGMGFQTGDKLGSGFGAGQPISLHFSHGEDVATGAKTYSAELLIGANYSSSARTGTFGPAASGALGTWPTNWVGDEGIYLIGSYASLPYDLNTVICGVFRKTDTGTRVASLSYVGAQVLRNIAYPPVGIPMIPKIRPFRHLLTR